MATRKHVVLVARAHTLFTIHEKPFRPPIRISNLVAFTARLHPLPLQVQSLLQQLQLDNARLVKLLASTQEYRDFAANMDTAGGLTYVPPHQVASERRPPAHATHADRNALSTFHLSGERHGWRSKGAGGAGMECSATI